MALLADETVGSTGHCPAQPDLQQMDLEFGMDREGSLNVLSHAPVISSGRDQHRSLEDVHSSVAISRGHWWKRLLSFSGPAFMVSVGYMDPGNWATDLAAGARFGYRLIWVILIS